MIQIGTYAVWSVTRLIGDENEGWVRVTCKADGRGDVVFEIGIHDAPAVGSEVVLGWT